MTVSPLEPVAGVDVTRVDTVQQFDLGMILPFSGGTWYQYVLTSTALTQYLAYVINRSYTCAAALTTTTDDASPVAVGWPQISGIGSGAYAWVAVKGLFTGAVAASCAQDVPLYTTAVSGVIDDTAQALVEGVKLITTVTGAANSPLYAVDFARTVIAGAYP